MNLETVAAKLAPNLLHLMKCTEGVFRTRDQSSQLLALHNLEDIQGRSNNKDEMEINI